MNTPGTEKHLCDRCGAPLGGAVIEAVCPRCVVRYSLLGFEQSMEELENPSPTNRFGDYELLEEIAHGGMGVVYRARQVSLNRIVALKMLLFGQFAGESAFDRFRAEAQIAARLQHPNIVAIHEIGETDGQPYFSMDYVAGQNLGELVRKGPLPARPAAEYVRKLALAVQYAHSHGVLHRDLKPANVLIDELDEPRITDFGLARQLTGDSQLTLNGQVLGSPNFMPPEQGTGARGQLGPASDVYGLGAILYCLLTARPPFLADTLEATLAQVLNTEPVEPRRLNPGVPRDLQTICLKCLEKNPGRRYGSAEALARDLERFLKCEPILARPLGPFGEAGRWCRRKPVVAAMTAAVFLLLVTVTVVLLTSARRIAAEARRTEQKARELRLNLYVADMNIASQSCYRNSLGHVNQIVCEYLPGALRHQFGTEVGRFVGTGEDLRGWEWRYLWGVCQDESLWVMEGHTNAVSCAVFSPNGKTVVTASLDATVRVWDVEKRRLAHLLTGFADPIPRFSVAFSPDGSVLAVADSIEIHLYASANWEKLRTLPNRVLSGGLFSLGIAFSPDGQTLSCNAETEVRHWDTASWQRRPSRPANVADVSHLLAYSRDGRYFATGTNTGILLWAHRQIGQIRFTWDRFMGPVASPSPPIRGWWLPGDGMARSSSGM